MRIVFLVLAMAASLAASAQKAVNPQTFANTITAEDLKKHLFIVAGPEMEGRRTATEGQRKAAAYIETQFKSLGLLPGNNGSYQQNYPVFEDSLAGASLEVNGKAFEVSKDFSLNLGAAYSSTMLVSEIVFVGNGITDSARDDYNGVNAKGKIVLLFPSATTNNNNNNRARGRAAGGGITGTAVDHGAAAILIVQQSVPRTGNGRGGQYINGFRSTIYPNTWYISEQVAQAIMGSDFTSTADSAKKGIAKAKTYKANVRLELNKVTNTVQSSNVMAYLEGTDLKDQYLFITAHYDHLGKRGDSVIFYGADDDGSGTVSVLELAEAFTKAKAAGKGPRRTIVFMTVSGEEEGLWGSQYYSENPAFPLDKTTADLNIDMIGRIDPNRKNGDSTNYVYVVGDDKLSSDLRPISEAMNKKYSKLELDYKFNDPNDQMRIYYRSDHFNFARKGVPIIFYFDGIHNDYHRPTDTPDKIDYPLLAKRGKLVFYTAWEMANRNDMMKRDIPLNTPGF